MPRKPRHEIVIPELPHHVIVRGNNRRNLFSYASYYRTFMRLVSEATQRFGIALHGLMLMRNHVHLVATPRDVDCLASWVKSFAQRYAWRRNRQRESTGKLFEQRYGAVPIRTERQLAATLPYLELNPVRAGLVVSADQWDWSTHRLHIGASVAVPDEIADAWTPHPWWLALGRDPATRHAAYRELTRLRREAQRAVDRESQPYTLVIERPDRSSARDAPGPIEMLRDEFNIYQPVRRDNR